MLRAVVDASDRTGISADPTTVVCDFETATMNAMRTTLGQHVAVQGCFFTSAKAHGARSRTWDWCGHTATMPTSATSAAWWTGWRFCRWPMSPLACNTYSSVCRRATPTTG